MCHIKQLPLFIMCEYYNDRSETVIQRVRPRNCALVVFFGFTHVNEANTRMSYGSVFVELLLMIRLSAST